MFDFNNASLHITKNEILKYITELQILERYCNNYKSKDSSFQSEFYNDKNPSCRIVISASGIPYYRDYGNGDYFTAFDYVSKKYGSNYHETCNIIANDFNIKSYQLSMSPKLLLNNEDSYKPVKIKSNIKPLIQPFNITDYNYWIQFGLTFDVLNYFNVKSCSHVLLNKGENHYTFEYKKNNPIYSYRFFKQDVEYFKIYFPMSSKKELKWLSNVGPECLQGYDQLPDSGNLLILTKSLKDVMCYYILGIPAIALQAETNKISDKSYTELCKRFKRIIVNFDDDEQGRISTGDFVSTYDLEFYFIDSEKDLSDYIKKHGLEKAELMIKNKIL
jgi:hypothetical protein